MCKVGQHPSILRDTGLLRSKTSERMLLRSIPKGKGIGEREASRTLQGMEHLGLVQAQHEEGGVCNQLQKRTLGFHLLSVELTQHRCVCLCT